MSSGFTVCIVGRPNVGKSTLFNKLTGTRRAIVDNYEGVTRDRMFEFADLEGVSAFLIDTGGFEPEAKDIILTQVREQVKLAIEEADVICFAVDGRAGLTNVDTVIADMLRKSGKRVVVVVNKLDSPKSQNDMADFYQLGFEDVLAVSAEHSIGLGEICEALTLGREKDLLATDEEDTEENDKPVAIAVVGCPNVGKSSLINKILGKERLAVSEIAGTTRDSIDSLVKWHGKQFLFTDTAGIRKKGRISQKLEKYSVIMSLKSISRSKIALLIIDATQGIRDQDVRIAGIIHAHAKGCAILVNKWDLIEKDSLSTERFKEDIGEKLKFLSYAPVNFISAETGQRINNIFETIELVSGEYNKRVETGPLNRKLKRWVQRKGPPVRADKRGKIYYGSQMKTAPPTFSFVVNQPNIFNDQYKRYIANRIRDEYGFIGAPIVINFQPRKGRE